MKKPSKTLKDLGRIEGLLSKQTARSAKVLARRKTGEAANPVTAGYYDRIAANQAAALADLSEIVHLMETLSRHIAEEDAAKAEKKAAKAELKKKAAAPAQAAKPAAKPAAKRIAPVKKTAAPRPARKAPVKRRPPTKAPTP